MQTSLFGNENISGINQRSKFIELHPLKYHLFRVVKDENKAVHINSIFTDYNDQHTPEAGFENRMAKYILCTKPEDIKNAITESISQKKHYYLCVTMDYAEFINLSEIFDNGN